MDKNLPDDYEFEWGFLENENRFVGINNVVDEITERVYLDENRIYPCVDLTVKKITQENRILIGGRIAGYEPREFGQNWTKRPGPFVYAIGQKLISKNVNYKSEEFINELIKKGLRFI